MKSFFFGIKDQNSVINQLELLLLHNKIKQNYLFVGEKGVGKKLTAIAFSKALLCGNNAYKIKQFNAEVIDDFIPFYDKGNSLKLDSIKKLIAQSIYITYENSYRIIFIENGERLTEESSNALLKILENPPKRTIFIITVTKIEKLKQTLLSRMEKYYFNLLSEKTLAEIFKKKGYENIPFKSIGSIDEIEFLLKHFDKKFLLFNDFLNLLISNNLQKIFSYAEFLAKKTFLKSLLNYYEKEAEKFFIFNIKKNYYEKTIIYEIIILNIEKIFNKINSYINEKHALEYGFLKISNKIKETKIL